MKVKLFILFITIAIGGRSYGFPGKSLPELQLTHLRTEMLEVPVGIDTRTPRLSWELKGSQRDLHQLAYQVMVSTSLTKLNAGQGDLWNSGKKDDAQSIHVVYAGASLKSRSECFWKVKVWTNKG